MKQCVYVGKKILWWDPHLLISLSDSHIIYKDIRYIFFFFSFVVNFILNVRFNKSLVFHAETVAFLPWTRALIPGLGRQNAVICMKLCTQVSTSVLSRGPTRKERGEVLLPIVLLLFKRERQRGKNSLWHSTCIEDTRKLRHWYK